MNKKNALPLVWMVLIIPVTVYFLAKNELVRHTHPRTQQQQHKRSNLQANASTTSPLHSQQHNAEHNGRANKPAGYKMM